MTFMNQTRFIAMKQLKEYRQPSLTKYGDVERITAGNTYGSFLDYDYPGGSPVDDLTFSITP